MRPTALVVVALSGCSLIRTTMPEPVEGWSKRSDCTTSHAPPIVDAVLGGVGLVVVAAGALPLASTGGVDPTTGKSTVPQSALLIGGGIAVAGFFAVSTIIGARRVGACSDALAAWDTAHPNDPDRPLVGEGREQLMARRYLECPIGELVTNGISFGRNNKWADAYRWGELEIVGCGKTTWCGTRNERLTCGPPPDMELAAQQLSVETGCAADSVKQLQRFAVVGRQGRDELVGQATYRLDACGQQYSCTVPLFAPYDNETPVPVLRDGGQLVCKPVVTGVPTQPVPPPPPVP